jgi:deoxyribose-phosphate aldolase
MNVDNLAGIVDHTFLKPFGGPEEIERIRGEAIRCGFAIVAINPAEVKTCVKLLSGTKVGVDAAIDKRATEIDTVIDVCAAQGGHPGVVRREIAKAILETRCLSDDEKIAVCRMACQEGADFVKTSTGFGTARASRMGTSHGVAIVRRLLEATP